MTKVRDYWVWSALALALLLPIYYVGVASSVKFGLLDWRLGYTELTLGLGPKLMIGVIGLAAAALVLAAFVAPANGRILALLALLIPIVGLAYDWQMRTDAAAAPPTHDISTDLMEPPSFSTEIAAARARVPDGNSLDLLAKRAVDGRAFADVQERAYPDIASVPTGLAVDVAFDQALAAARASPWRLGRIDREAGVIEATDRSFWYGFTDDIVIRVRPDGSGARIDMRSVARARAADGGVNARRVREYLAQVRARVRDAEGA